MLTLNLVKLSRTADVPPDKSSGFSWTHIHDSLVVVFDTFRSGSSSSELMRIVQATQVLYDIPLEHMINEGKQRAQMLARTGVEVIAERLPISAIVKCPLLALRYSLPDQEKIRRIQLKFASNLEYDTAISHLRQLGLHMTSPKSATPTTIPPSPRPQSGGLSCPPSQLSEITSRPSTAIASNSTSMQDHFRDVAVARPLSARHPLEPPVLFPRPDSASTMHTHDRLPTLPTVSEESSTSLTRPETAILFTRPSSGDLPPRRELPFSRPDSPQSRGSDSIRLASRSSNSMMAPPPLPPPSRAGPRRPGSSAASSYEAELAPLPKPTIIENIQSEPQTKLTAKRTAGRSVSKTSRPQTAMAKGKENQPLTGFPTPYRPATSDGIARKRPLSAISDAAQNENRTELQGALPSPPASEATYHPHLNLENNNGADNAFSTLAEYATQSDDRRMAALNSFILQHLEDENFLTLIDDMDACWARLAPGMGG